MITGAMVTTAGDVLDAHANLLPIHLLINKNLHRAALHFATLPTTHPLHGAVKNAARHHMKRHPTPLHYLMNNYQDVKPHLIETIKPVRKSSAWAPKLAVRIADMREKAKEEDETDRARLRVYSDGSGIGGKIGAAAVLYRDGILWQTRRLQLGSDKHHTVYKAEGIGMILGLQLLWEEREEIEGMVPLGVDNQAAIIATSSIRPGPSHYIWDIFHQQLNTALRAHVDLDLLICWTPGHSDIAGNEQADEEAKKAAEEGSSTNNKLPKPLRGPLPRSKSAACQAHHGKLKRVAAKQWRKSPRYQHIEHIDSSLPSKTFLKLIAPLPRNQAALLTQLRTGHVPLAKHLHCISKADSPICPCCREHEETVEHYLIHCPAHSTARQTLHIFGHDTRDRTKLLSKPELMGPLFRFAAETGQFRTVFGDLQAPIDIAFDNLDL